jgi:hypothetical protein
MLHTGNLVHSGIAQRFVTSVMGINNALDRVFDNMLALLYDVLDDASNLASSSFHHLSQIIIITTMMPHVFPRWGRRAVLLLKFMYTPKREAE